MSHAQFFLSFDVIGYLRGLGRVTSLIGFVGLHYESESTGKTLTCQGNSLAAARLVTPKITLDEPIFRAYYFPMSETYIDPNSNLDPQDSNHRLAKIGSEEYYDEKPDFSQPTMDDPYGGFEGCWPGDGSGMDDLADYNQMEGDDC